MHCSGTSGSQKAWSAEPEPMPRSDGVAQGAANPRVAGRRSRTARQVERMRIGADPPMAITETLPERRATCRCLRAIDSLEIRAICPSPLLPVCRERTNHCSAHSESEGDEPNHHG